MIRVTQQHQQTDTDVTRCAKRMHLTRHLKQRRSECSRSRQPRLAVHRALLDRKILDSKWPISLRGSRERCRRLARLSGGRVSGVRHYRSQGSKIGTQEVSGKDVAMLQLNEWVGAGFAVAGSSGSKHLQFIWNTSTTVTPWHVDDTDGVLLCLRGTKIVSFLPCTVQCTNPFVPLEEARLGVKCQPHSHITPQTYHISRGEYIVIPKYYWHSVRSSEGSLAVSYAVCRCALSSTSPGSLVTAQP